MQSIKLSSDLRAHLLVLSFSGFWTDLVRGDLVDAMAWGFGLSARKAEKVLKRKHKLCWQHTDKNAEIITGVTVI